MAVYALIHGAYDSGGYWSLVKPLLESMGHDVVAPDMPIDREGATLTDCADAVIDAVGDGSDVIVVAQSFGGCIAPIVASRIPVSLLALVAPMVPKPQERNADYFGNTGYSVTTGGDFDGDAVFYHDVPSDIVEMARTFGRPQVACLDDDPLPIDSWPGVPTRAVIGSLDRLFPPDYLRDVIEDRLGFTPDVIQCGHCIALAKPAELVAWLEAQREAVGA